MDGGVLEDVRIRGLTMRDGRNAPIYIPAGCEAERTTRRRSGEAARRQHPRCRLRATLLGHADDCQRHTGPSDRRCGAARYSYDDARRRHRENGGDRAAGGRPVLSRSRELRHRPTGMRAVRAAHQRPRCEAVFDRLRAPPMRDQRLGCRISRADRFPSGARGAFGCCRSSGASAMSGLCGTALMDEFATSAWHRGQLIAFSAVDGLTDYQNGLVIRTTEDPAGLEIVRPDTARITFGEPPEREIIVSCDVFSFRTASGLVRGCLLACASSADRRKRRLVRRGRHDPLRVAGGPLSHRIGVAFRPGSAGCRF